MEINSIFVGEETGEGLYAFRYEEEKVNEFHRLLNLWTDVFYIKSYLKKNEGYLTCGFYKGYSFADLITKIFREALELENLFLNFEEDFFKNITNLQEIFRPLSDGEYIIPLHQKTKCSIYNWKFRKAMLRFYAIRISSNTYIITGGAIKLVKKMEDHPDTKQELEKFKLVRKFLASKDIQGDEDLMFVL